MPTTTYRRIVSILLVALSACDTPRTEATKETVAPAERDTTEYTLTGQGDTTLVLIHGWNITQDYWSHQVAAFSDDYTVLTMNLVTEALIQDSNRDWTIDNFAQDITTIIQQENLTNLILVGHSMGGEIALTVRELLPDKTVAIIGVDSFKDAGFILTDKVENHVDSFMVQFAEDYAGNVEQMVTVGLFEPNTKHRQAYERVLHDYQTADPTVAMAIYRNLFPAYVATKEKIAQLPFPLRMIVSDYSPLNEEALKEYAGSGYRIKTINHSGHFPMIEQPERFNQALNEFLVAIRRASSQ